MARPSLRDVWQKLDRDGDLEEFSTSSRAFTPESTPRVWAAEKAAAGKAAAEKTAAEKAAAEKSAADVAAAPEDAAAEECRSAALEQSNLLIDRLDYRIDRLNYRILLQHWKKYTLFLLQGAKILERNQQLEQL